MEKKVLSRVMLPLLTIVLALASMMPLVSAPPDPVVWNLEINHASTFWGIPMDNNWGTPAWHIRAAIAHLFDKQDFLNYMTTNGYLSGVTMIDNFAPNLGPPLSNWYLNWATVPGLLSAVDPWHPGAVSLYNNVPMASDLLEARDHLVLAGWSDNSPPGGDGIIDNPPTSQIDIMWNTGNVIRQKLAEWLEQKIEYIFGGADVVNLVSGSWATVILPRYVAGNWHLFSMGFLMPNNPPPESLRAYRSPNLINYVDPIYDQRITATGMFSQTNAKIAEGSFGAIIGTIPIWCK